ncbi:GNAT family N-acetyltransferase [Acidiferrobacter thiooxydans]|jgi:GNAT superfamily N-acetyltransferase|uniref:N-acetyltransferase n=1 Tax=Acidiferrobacter thiooxydans TaxID=163359 RepID=A0A368HB83_9GAMM|nr:GNAT family N-acetyltransferase [Acidiferrobacter thiooxydans]RCN55704.1 N-acetyltransferase [Acidiferrobacter thiooxydans]RCN59441.1 N-acetyltransferase [Acidiferrobacter thiooxydans]UEO01208.1 GNAT family N-acetyltransferase [Acidiferrobacter thiooxydans]
MITSTTVPQYVDDEDGVRRCYPLMAQLRPHLATEDEFVDRWRRQVAGGYRLLALLEGSRVIALAGFRVQENLVYGRFLYVDDLVTDGALRGRGHGEHLMARLKREACILGCGRLVLDTPLGNSLGHRFYFRNGLLATSLRFNIAIAQ